VVVAGFFWGLHAYVTDRNFQTTDHALKNVIELQASAIYNGYFAWTTLYDTVLQGDFAKVTELVEDIKDNFPLVDSLEFERGLPPDERYAISLDGELLRIEYSIQNDDGTATVPDMFAVAIIQVRKLLEIVSPHGFKVDIANGRKASYGIPISTSVVFQSNEHRRYSFGEHFDRLAHSSALCQEKRILFQHPRAGIDYLSLRANR